MEKNLSGYKITHTPRNWSTGRFIKADPCYHGYTRPDWREIYVNLHADKTPEWILTHELIHAELFDAGKYGVDSHNENFIDQLTERRMNDQKNVPTDFS